MCLRHIEPQLRKVLKRVLERAGTFCADASKPKQWAPPREDMPSAHLVDIASVGFHLIHEHQQGLLSFRIKCARDIS